MVEISNTFLSTNAEDCPPHCCINVAWAFSQPSVKGGNGNNKKTPNYVAYKEDKFLSFFSIFSNLIFTFFACIEISVWIMMKREIKWSALTDCRIIFLSSCFELTFITCDIKDFSQVCSSSRLSVCTLQVTFSNFFFLLVHIDNRKNWFESWHLSGIRVNKK